MKGITRHDKGASLAQRIAIYTIHVLLICVVSMYLTLQPKSVWAQPCSTIGGQVESVEGNATIAGLQIHIGDAICLNDEIVTGSQSRAAIRLASTQTVVRVKQNSTFVVQESAAGGSLLKLLNGVLFLFSRNPQDLNVNTPYLNAAIEGTEFVIEALPNRNEISVIEGKIQLSNDFGTLQVGSGQVASAGPDEAPIRRILIEPLDAVKWALYFPPLNDSETVSDSVRSAARFLARGDIVNAEVALAASTEEAAALALQAIIAVTQNRSDDAIQLAEQAVALAPRSSLAYSALSYAQQASFDLDKAWQSAQRSVEINDMSVFALTRLAEVEISRGYFQRAFILAERAAKLNPGYSRSYSMLGFANLNLRNYSAARIAFDNAITLDNSDPMPHLGRGLVSFKHRQIMEGRKLLEIAVSLDPLNSLYRSYLGKAYYEEGAPELSDIQFELAKSFDRYDPTPWYYDAISFSLNKTPVQELDNLNRAIQLNDNRAIYRSRFTLDSDLATRGVNIASLYQRLGANDQARVEATRSLGIDPANHSGHRFLAGAYSRLPRHEVSRVSELLQSQLLNPLNTDPIVPSSSYAYIDSALDSGTSITSGLNEYTSVFERNGPKLRAAVRAGEHDVLDGEIAGLWLWSNAVVSVGLESQNSDGYRPNNDVSHELGNIFTQWSPNSRISVQAEYRHRLSRQGDLRQSFDPDQFSTTLRRNVTSELARVGSNLTIAKGSNFLISGVSTRVSSTLTDDSPAGANQTGDLNFDGETNAQQVEIQHIFSRPGFSLISGGGIVNSDFESERLVTVGGEAIPPVNTEIERTENNIYIYANKGVTSNLDMTLGVAYAEQESNEEAERMVQPKLGLQWHLTDRTTLRFAYFKSFKRFLVADHSVEPTQVAGFNQIFDDTDGTKAKRVAAALDFHANSKLTFSAEVSQRSSDFVVSETISDREERTFGTSIFWTMSEKIAVAANVFLDHYENLNPIQNGISFLKTVRSPVTVTYFLKNNAYLRATGLYIHQDLSRPNSSLAQTGSTDTAILNLSFGYPFRKEKGNISVIAHNITNTEFRYQDSEFRSAQVLQATEVVPERRVVLQATYQFN